MPVKVFDGSLPPSSPVTLGIDQSLTGFAISAVCVDSPEFYKTWVYASTYKGVRRLIDIRFWMIERFDEFWLHNNEIKDIAMEGTVRASFSASALGELSGIVKTTIWDYFDATYADNQHLRLPLQIPPTTVKKFAAEKGNATKLDMLNKIRDRWNADFGKNDNAADSYAIARMATGVSITELEAEIIKQIKDPKYRDSSV
jgi:Holliday junction resolvasome RuvABC endonuclease subunit